MRRLVLSFFLSVCIFFSLHAQMVTPALTAYKQPGYHDYLPLNYRSTTEKCLCLIRLRENGELRYDQELDIREHSHFKEIHGNKHDMCFTVNEPEYVNVIGTQAGSSVSISAADSHKIYNYYFHPYRIDSDRIYLTGVSKGGECGCAWAVWIFKSSNEITVPGKMTETTDFMIVRMVKSDNTTI